VFKIFVTKKNPQHGGGGDRTSHGSQAFKKIGQSAWSKKKPFSGGGKGFSGVFSEKARENVPQTPPKKYNRKRYSWAKKVSGEKGGGKKHCEGRDTDKLILVAGRDR